MKKISKDELTRRLSVKMDTTHKYALQFFDYLIETMQECLEKNTDITIRNFGSFQVRRNDARQGRNPKTGEPILIPSQKRIHFKAGKFLKQEVCE